MQHFSVSHDFRSVFFLHLIKLLWTIRQIRPLWGFSYKNISSETSAQLSALTMKILIQLHLREDLFVLFWQQLCVKKQLSILDASPPVLSLMSKLSWRLSRHVGESTSIFQQFSLMTIYRRRKPSVSRVFWQRRTSKSAHATVVLCHQLYSLYLGIMYTRAPLWNL